MKYSDENRGIIQDRKNFSRIRDFSGLKYGKITPTDIDAIIDFGNKAVVIIETKFGNSQMPLGQRIALERLADTVDESGRRGLAIVASYNNQEGDIDFASAIVSEYRTCHRWKTTKNSLTVRELIDNFLEYHGLGEKYLG